MNARTGVMICGHGSRHPLAANEFAALVNDVARHLPDYCVASGFLEFSSPTIPEGLEKLRQQGCTRILTVPGTLFSAGHAQNDIPALLAAFAAKHGVPLHYGRELGPDVKMAAAASARVREALQTLAPVSPADTALLVAGRGASDPGALAAMQSLTGMVQAEMQFGVALTAYAGMGAPLLPEALEQVLQSGLKRIAVMPYFLFAGKLVSRIYDQTDAAAIKNPHIEFVKTHYLNNHPLVIACFADRIRQTAETGIPIHE